MSGMNEAVSIIDGGTFYADIALLMTERGYHTRVLCKNQVSSQFFIKFCVSETHFLIFPIEGFGRVGQLTDFFKISFRSPPSCFNISNADIRTDGSNESILLISSTSKEEASGRLI